MIAPGLLHIPVEQIALLNRRRKVMGDIDELAAEISANGQLQPGVVRRPNDRDISEGVDPNATPWVLVAGGRRFAAVCKAGLDTYMALDFGSLPPLRQKIVELNENLFRKNLEWDEEVLLKDEIHQLKTQEATQEGKVWTQVDTANFLGETPANTSRDLQLAREVKVNPDLRKVETKVGAFRSMKYDKSIAERTARVDQSARFKVKDRLVTADMRDFIRTLPENSIDLNFSDFKFGIDYDFDTADPSAYEDDVESLKDLLTDVIPQMMRVTKPTGWMALMMGSTNYEFLKNLCEHCCAIHYEYVDEHDHYAECKYLKVEDPEWIWFRPNSRNPSKWPELHAQNQYEKFCVVNMGQAVLVQKNKGNVLVHDAIYEDRLHEMQRPHSLCVDVIERLTVGGELVADFCYGSGSALAAAAELQRNFLGCDLNPNNYDRAVMWISEHYKAPFTLVT